VSTETKLATLRMEFNAQETELLSTPCANCGHALQAHSRVRPEVCVANGRWRCECIGFLDPGERLALDV